MQFPAKETVPEFKLMLFWVQSPVKTRFPESPVMLPLPDVIPSTFMPAVPENVRFPLLVRFPATVKSKNARTSVPAVIKTSLKSRLPPVPGSVSFCPVPENSTLPLLCSKVPASRFPSKTVVPELAVRVPPTVQSAPKSTLPLPAVKSPETEHSPPKAAGPLSKETSACWKKPLNSRFPEPPEILPVPVTTPETEREAEEPLKKTLPLLTRFEPIVIFTVVELFSIPLAFISIVPSTMSFPPFPRARVLFSPRIIVFTSIVSPLGTVITCLEGESGKTTLSPGTGTLPKSQLELTP